MKKNKVTFLLDKNNNWIEEFLLNSSLVEINTKYDIKITHNYLDIKGQDIVFILGYTKILKDDFLKTNKLNLVIHASDLPKGKGFAPTQ